MPALAMIGGIDALMQAVARNKLTQSSTIYTSLLNFFTANDQDRRFP